MDPTSEGLQDQQLSDHDPETRLLVFLKGLAEKVDKNNNGTDDAVPNRVSIGLNDAAPGATDVTVKTSVNITHNIIADATITATVGYDKLTLPPDLKETLRKNVNIPSLEPRHRTPLHIAIQTGLNEITRQLIDAGADLDALDKNCMQPLHVACDKGNEDLIKLLLEKGATIRGPDRDGWGLFHCVSYYEMDAKLLDLLIAVDREHLDRKEYFNGWTPINRAAYFGRQSVVDALLKAGVDLGMADKNGWTPMMTAIEEAHFQIFDKMVDHLAEIGSNDADIPRGVIDQRDDEGMTVLMTLCVADPSPASEASLRNFLRKLRPRTDITDNIDQTALNHAMALAKTSDSPHAQNKALEMIKWWPRQTLLRQNMAKETAFDDLSGPLLDALVSRLKNDLLMRDKLLCWLAPRSELHATAIDILSKLKPRETIDALDHKDEWTLVDWAIYHRKPRVMLNCSAPDKFGNRIINELEKWHPYSKKKRNTDRKDELTPRKVLDEMGDILKFLPQMRTKNPNRRWKVSRPTGDMRMCLEHYNAAVVKFHQRELEAFRFRKIDKIVYNDDPVTVITLGQIEQSDSAGETAAEPAKQGFANTDSTFTWVHLPAANNTVMKIMKTQSEKERGYQEKLASFLQASWVQVPDRTSASRFMRPRYVRMPQEGLALDTNKTRKNATALDASDEKDMPKTILRVSQLWAWTIGDKWLVTSTSCAKMEKANEFVEEIREHLRRRADDGSLNGGLRSPQELSKVIAEYCIGSYERKHKLETRRSDPPKQDQQRLSPVRSQQIPPSTEERSIRQVFSDFINEIGRKETALFSQFSKQPVELDEKHSRAKNHSLTITDVLGATRRASKLLFQIKDVRDELHILKTIADYQEKVQTSMDKAIHSASNAAFDENMKAKYVRNDVDELDRLACNIQEALQTTLTLYETEIANRQAKEAVDQGKRVIIFTVVTVWF
ncbi:Ankyrin repeat and protein kinase domain-containing protein 1 [Colletotrichum sp. SAR11_240]|nr:Ankyrin repeat and protein kinase domain-containing protein 1 [Colletotrichum sp. SAR11_240]